MNWLSLLVLLTVAGLAHGTWDNCGYVAPGPGREPWQHLRPSLEGTRLSPMARPQLPPTMGSLSSLPAARCWHGQTSHGLPWPAVRARPCGEGRGLSFSLSHSRP
uniref:Uncharacterized protein n=1 Tax=Serinus canaria TaxID=9135 RepID=A0A8C9MS60_SERCA